MNIFNKIIMAVALIATFAMTGCMTLPASAQGNPSATGPVEVPPLTSADIAGLPNTVCELSQGVDIPTSTPGFDSTWDSDRFGIGKLLTVIVDPVLCDVGDMGGKMVNKSDVDERAVAIINKPDTIMMMHCTTMDGIGTSQCEAFGKTHYRINGEFLLGISNYALAKSRAAVQAIDAERTANDVCNGDKACISKYLQLRADIDQEINDATHP